MPHAGVVDAMVAAMAQALMMRGVAARKRPSR
jgi:hypothetical protein